MSRRVVAPTRAELEGWLVRHRECVAAGVPVGALQLERARRVESELARGVRL